MPLCGHPILRLDYLRWILFSLSLLSALVSLLTFVRAPDYVWTWKRTTKASPPTLLIHGVPGTLTHQAGL